MSLYDRLVAAVAALPDDASVTLSVGWLRHELETEGVEDSTTGPLADLTVDEVAEALGRASSTVRAWLIAGDLDGYKLNSREWRVTRSALRRYLDAQRRASDNGEPEPPAPSNRYHRGAWRRHYRKTAQ